jgi:hypothetical protein
MLKTRHRRPSGLFFLMALSAGCASSPPVNVTPSDEAGVVTPDASLGGGDLLGDGSIATLQSDGQAIASLSITPSDPVLDVDVVNGAVTRVALGDGGVASVVFQAAPARAPYLRLGPSTAENSACSTSRRAYLRQTETMPAPAPCPQPTAT